jgi:hypothetical protein
MGFVDACRGDLRLWISNYRRLVSALASGEVVATFEVGQVAPPWPEPALISEVLAVADHHMAVSLSLETLRESLVYVSENRPPFYAGRSWALLETMRFIERAATPQLFAARMQEARLYSGLKLQEISARTAHPEIQRITGRERIATSTLSNLCNPKYKRFPRPETVRAFLTILGAPEPVIDVWTTMLAIAVSLKSRKDSGHGIPPTEEWFALVDRYFNNNYLRTSPGIIATGTQAPAALPQPRSSGHSAR